MRIRLQRVGGLGWCAHKQDRRAPEGRATSGVGGSETGMGNQGTKLAPLHSFQLLGPKTASLGPKPRVPRRCSAGCHPVVGVEQQQQASKPRPTE